MNRVAVRETFQTIMITTMYNFKVSWADTSAKVFCLFLQTDRLILLTPIETDRENKKNEIYLLKEIQQQRYFKHTQTLLAPRVQIKNNFL